MKASTNCGLCQFQKFCEMEGNPKRLREGEGGRSLCPKLPEMKLLRCRNCIFCRKSKSIGGSGEYAMENGHPIYTCAAMHYVRMRPDGKIPKTTPRDCPIKEAKRKCL